MERRRMMRRSCLISPRGVDFMAKPVMGSYSPALDAVYGKQP